MFIYIIPYLYMIIFSLLSLKLAKNARRFIFFLGGLPALLIVALRGLTGTDTYTYVSILSSTPIELEENIHNVDFFFKQYIILIQYLEIPPQISLNILGVALALILFTIFSKNRSSIIIFSSLVFPIFFYDMTMNGIRYGLAFALSVPFILEPIKKLYFFNKTKIYLIIALLNHKSALLFIGFKMLRHLTLMNIIFLTLFMVTNVFLLQDYLLIKLQAYINIAPSSSFSGLQPLILMLGICCVNSVFFKKNNKRNSLLLAIQIFFYIITQFSYAGIRLQFIVLFFTIIMLVNDHKNNPQQIYILLLYFIGFLGFLLKMRNMIDGYGLGNSPFLPYLFLWE